MSAVPLKMKKTCSTCKKQKDVQAFRKDKNREFGYQGKCKACAKAYDKEDYRRNREKYLKQARAYQRSGGPPRFAALLVRNAKKRSRQKQRLCTLTTEDILSLREKQANQCVYLNTEMVWRPGTGIFQVSLDRIDSSQGYVLANCQLVCDGINRLKSDMKEEDFLYLLKLVARPARGRLPPLLPYPDFTSAQKRKFGDLYRRMKNSPRKATRNVTREELHHLREKHQDRCVMTGIHVTWEYNQFTTASWDRIDSDGDYEANNMQLTIWPINRMKWNHSDKEAMEMIHCIQDVYGETAFDL